MPGFLGGSSGSSGSSGEITFPKEFIDPVTKLRVSQPENLIDTDFEYGLQPTKWETVELINNTPSFFSKSGDTTIPSIISIATNNGTREITVTTATDHGLAVGIPINVTGTKSVTADGSYVINSIPNTSTFTYLCKDEQSGNNSIEDLYSSIITGEFFQGSQIRIADAEGVTTDAEPISTLTVKTDSTHGFGLNTPFYFLNLNSTISQEFEASNTAAKSFDSSNSATAQTFDGSNTLSTFNIDWSNSATVGGVTSTISAVDTVNDTITVTHGAETFASKPLGTPLYYNLSVPASSGYFLTNPRGVIFLKTTNSLNVGGQSTFQVSATPDGDVIDIVSSMSGTFQLANQARTFAGNNQNALTQSTITVVKETAYVFDGSNSDVATNGIASIIGYSDTILLSVTAGAGLDYYIGAMVKYTTTGSAATGLTNNATYFINTFVASATPNLYNVTLKALPNSASALAPTGGSGTQTLTKIGLSLDKDIIHVKNAAFAQGDMVQYSFPVGGRFNTSDIAQEKLFYFISFAYDSHNFELSESIFSPISATGGATSEVVLSDRTYKVHAFTTVGTTNFVVSSSGTVDYLIVGGGGGGGGEAGGGGGAGGLVYGSVAVTPQTYSIVVGNGGATYTINGEVDGNSSSPGGNSSAFGVTALGGGRGGSFNGGNVTGVSNGANGGSGGGGASTANASFTAGGTKQQSAPGFGFDGGGGRLQVNYFGGGGGGAGAAAESAFPNKPGSGGAGRYYGNIFGTNFGQFGWFASGGGGGSHPTSSQGFAALGGGGDGGAEITGDSRGRAGLANTGGGGGGAADDTSAPPANGGVGGSGVVLVRYPITPPVPFVAGVATGGTTSSVTENGITYAVHTFTTVGNSNFVVSNSGSMNRFETLVVGGGGAGGNNGGGGGGGGAVILAVTQASPGTYPVVVGAGGAKFPNNHGYSNAGNRGENGGTSSVFGITATGGGAGGIHDGIPGANGANGGGGGSNTASASVGTAPTLPVGVTGKVYAGNAGGPASRSNPSVAAERGGGGGGAGKPGGLMMAGDGVQSNIDGTMYYYGGGGGHGAWSTYAGHGGRGGGGGGGSQNQTGGVGDTSGRNAAANGQTGANRSDSGGNAGANTGGGGGGGCFYSDSGVRSGNGGSGIVIIRYPVAIV